MLGLFANPTRWIRGGAPSSGLGCAGPARGYPPKDLALDVVDLNVDRMDKN